MDLKKMFNYWLRAYQTKFTFQLFNGRATREEFWGFMVLHIPPLSATERKKNSQRYYYPLTK